MYAAILWIIQWLERERGEGRERERREREREREIHLCYLLYTVCLDSCSGQVLQQGSRQRTDKVKVETVVELCLAVLTDPVNVLSRWTDKVDSNCILNLISRLVNQPV